MCGPSRPPWSSVGEQVLHGEQGVDFRGVEPQAGQFELAAGRAVAFIVAVAAGVAVPGDGRVEAIAQVFEVALDGGGRDFQRFDEDLKRDDAAFGDELVDFVEAFGAIHGIPLCT